MPQTCWPKRMSGPSPPLRIPCQPVHTSPRLQPPLYIFATFPIPSQSWLPMQLLAPELSSLTPPSQSPPTRKTIRQTMRWLQRSPSLQAPVPVHLWSSTNHLVSWAFCVVPRSTSSFHSWTAWCWASASYLPMKLHSAWDGQTPRYVGRNCNPIRMSSITDHQYLSDLPNLPPSTPRGPWSRDSRTAVGTSQNIERHCFPGVDAWQQQQPSNPDSTIETIIDQENGSALEYEIQKRHFFWLRDTCRGSYCPLWPFFACI